MANWCDNQVVFSGKPADLEKIREFFKQVMENADQAARHWLPPFVIDMELVDDKICYCSRWLPNNPALLQLSEYCNVEFVNRYDELGMGIFGEASNKNGLYDDVRLDFNDFQAYAYDQPTGLYIYDGKNYSFEWPIFEQLLEKKKAENRYFKTTSNIAKEELDHLYGEMTKADLVLKFAEHKNFKESRAQFLTIDNDTLNEIEEYLTATSDYGREQFSTEDKYIAMSFLKVLKKEWNERRPPSIGLSR